MNIKQKPLLQLHKTLGPVNPDSSSSDQRTKFKHRRDDLSSPLLHKDSFTSNSEKLMDFEGSGDLEPDYVKGDGILSGDHDDLQNEMWRSKPKLQRTATNESMKSDSRQMN